MACLHRSLWGEPPSTNRGPWFLRIYQDLYVIILGDPGADSGNEEKSKRTEKYGTKKSRERREEPLGTMSYQTSSKRSPPFWLLIGARKTQVFWHQSTSRYDLRSSKDSLLLSYPKPLSKATLVHDRSFTYAAPKLWNTLPLAIRSVNTVNDFKGKLKTYLFSKAFLLKSE